MITAMKLILPTSSATNQPRNLFRLICFIVIGYLLITSQLACADDKSDRPNFVFILADDLAWNDTSFAMDPNDPLSKSDYIETPNLNRLASEGMVFSHAYAPAPLCTPTRRSIQFGMTPARQKGTEFLGSFDPAPHLSIAQMLKKIDPDYACAHFGKWGEVMTGIFQDRSTEEPGLPHNLAYDISDGRTGNMTGTYYHQRLNKENYHRNFKNEIYDDPKLTFSVSERASRFLKDQKKSRKPFYLQVSYYAVHTAAQSKKETFEKYSKKGPIPVQASDGIAPMTDDMDQGIGMILDTLRSLGLDENTYVIFTSDNGGEVLPPKYLSTEDKTRLPRNHPLRESKHWLYEGGIRVPFIVAGPGIRAGSHSSEPIVGYDLWTTLYDLAGGEFEISDEVDAISITAALFEVNEGKLKRPEPGIVFHRPKSFIQPVSALRKGDYKLVVHWETGEKELYDLSSDIGESNDIASKQPDIADALYSALVAYLKSVEAEGAEYYQ